MSVIVDLRAQTPEIVLPSVTDLTDPLRYKNSEPAMFSMESLRDLTFNIYCCTSQPCTYFERVN